VDLITQHIKELREICRRHQVKSLHAFGSITSESFTSNSDIDLLVDFESINLSDYADNYFDLKYSLQHLFERQVDLIENKSVKNPYVRQKIEQQKKLLYGSGN
jgi:predicted nucleotidyltransferase